MAVRPDYAPPRKRSVLIAGHATSINLEPMFWDAFEAAARQRRHHPGRVRHPKGQGARHGRLTTRAIRAECAFCGAQSQVVDASGGGEELGEGLGWGVVVEGGPGSGVECGGDFGEAFRAVLGEVGALLEPVAE